MPGYCSKCYRTAPCVSVEGLHCAGWQVGGPFNSMGWKCPVCLGDELFSLMEKVMAVRAKVRCNGVTGNEVSFYTVYEPDSDKDSENARFTKATPWGEIKLGIDNPAALAQFEAGKEYYVDFTPAASGG
jgi:hypothetical protein